VLVMAAGSVARTLPIPGLAEHGIGFKNVGEAIYLRNHVLARLDAASSTDDPEVRRRALTFTFVGGGYAGVEAFAELEDMARYAITHYYPRLSSADMRWVLVEAMGRILPEVDLDMAAWTVKQLTARGWTCGSTPGWSRSPTAAWSSCPTATSSPATPWCGRRAPSPTRC
jgi:NADH dehydrogenase